MRYFIENLNQIFDLEQKIKRNETSSVFQVVVREPSQIKRLTWFLLKLDINFERKPLGSGITCFYIDLDVPFFIKPKGKEDNE